MLFKTILQFLIVLLISVIIAGVYYNYFLKKSGIEEKAEKIVKENDNNIVEKNVDDIDEKKEIEILKKNDNQIIEKKSSNIKSNNLVSEDNKNIINNKNSENVKTEKESSRSLSNTLTEVEYLTTDQKGNKYKIFAKSAVTNKQDRNILELNEVRGIISSAKRSNIYIVSDFAKYNSSNQNSNFYQNVVINFEEKQIDCDFFDIDMQTNIAIAYGNVIVTDPKSIMRAGKITLDIQTKDINIEPEVKKKINIETE